MSVAAVRAAAVVFPVVAALGVGIVFQCAGSEALSSLVCISTDTAVEPDACLSQCGPGAAADATADQNIYPLFCQKCGQSTVTAATGVDDPGGENSAFLCLIELKLGGMPKVLKNFSVRVDEPLFL